MNLNLLKRQVSIWSPIHKEMILVYTLLKKKKRFHNYKKESILFLEKWFLEGKWGLPNLITEPSFSLVRKQIFTTFIFFTRGLFVPGIA